MGEVIVEYDYAARDSDELTIRKGDIIKDVVKKRGGWWEGVLNNKKGLFPDNFVKTLEKGPTVVLRNKRDASRIRQCRVVFSYTQDHEDELNLNVGDIIDIIGEEEEGWWRGVLRGKEGVFPSNFVEEIVLPVPHPKPSSREDAATVCEPESKTPMLPTKPSKQLCEVKFPYKAQNEDELSFKKGDIVTLISKESQDPGWWKGELNGKIGVFPDNFVTLNIGSDERNSTEEDRCSNVDAGAIKTSSVALQRKSLEAKIDKSSGDSNVILNKTPPLPGKKPLIPIKKSPSSTSSGIFSEIKKKVIDAVDGVTGSKIISDKSERTETQNVSENDFDQIERRSLLTDIRATRAKAPGRRLPSVLHKEEENSMLNGNAEHLVEQDNLPRNISPVSESNDNAENRHIREWEKHKAPWLEEMKINQAKRTSNPPGPDTKLKLTPTTDSNLEKEKASSDQCSESDLTKSVSAMDVSNSFTTVNIKQKFSNEVDKASIRVKPSVITSATGITNRQSLPVSLKDNSVTSSQSIGIITLSKESSNIQAAKLTQISPSVNIKNSITQKPVAEKSNENMNSDSENLCFSQKQYNQLVERIEKLEAVVENQKQAIDVLRSKLQIETDMRMLLQEKVLQKF